MNKQAHITLFGAGNMGSAMLRGWIKAGFGRMIDVIAPRPGPHITALADKAGHIRLNPAPCPTDFIIIAVKPDIFGDCAADIARRLTTQTDIVSIMAGITLATLEDRLSTPHITRAMPNTPGLIGKGVTAFCPGKRARKETAGRVRALLEPLGTVEGPFSEDLLPAITTLSGCGPAYVFLLAEMMAQAGTAFGLDETLAMRLARKTIEGTGALMQESDEDVATMRRRVTSPNGVTESALAVLMAKDALPALFKQAVQNAMETDRALSETAR